jgi:hypothetical protein
LTRGGGGEGGSNWEKMLTPHLHLVAQSRVDEATPPLSHPSLWHAQGQLISKEDIWMQIIFSEMCIFYFTQILKNLL